MQYADCGLGVETKTMINVKNRLFYRCVSFEDSSAGSYVEVWLTERGGCSMYGVFGAYTQWAVVFLIIFVLFFLLVPAYREVCQTVPVA